MKSISRRHFIACVSTTLASPLHAQPSSPMPWLDGEWLDHARGRPLPWRLRTPRGTGPTPLVLFSHGLGGSRQGGEVWGEAWCAAGFMVLHLQHVGSDTQLLQSRGQRALLAAASATELIQRVRDVQFALDQVQTLATQPHPVWGRCRQQAVGLAGHSFGAQTVQALAGQRFGLAAAPVNEPRVTAFMAFSPHHGRDRLTPEQAFGQIRRPMLCLTGTADNDPLGRERDPEHAVARRRLVYQGLPAGAKAELVLHGADHYSLAGHHHLPPLISRWGREPGAEAEQTRHHALLSQVTSAWWQAHLQNDAAANAWLQAPTGLASNDIWQRA